MLVGLFSIRFVLQALGEESYGVYAVVGGVVAMLDVFSASLSSASMRFLANSLGAGILETTKKTFTNVISIHIVFGLLLVLVLEIGGFIMFTSVLNIPEGQLTSARIVYQCMVATSFFTMISIPFDAIINAHENLLFLSIVTIIGNVFMLALGVYLAFYCQYDKLVSYGFGVMMIQIGQIMVKAIYSRFNYDECVFKPKLYFEWSFIRPVLSFIGWDFITSSVSVVTNQLKSIIINIFFGVKLNAGQGIANQVNGRVNQVSIGITRSITPQMNKSEGAGDRERLIRLTNIGVKYTSFMFITLAIPIMVEINYIFKIWLGIIPSYAVIFCQLIMLTQILSKLTWQLGNAIRAVGNIKHMSLIEAGLNIISIVLIFFLLKSGLDAVWIYIVSIIFTVFSGLFRLMLAKKIVGISPVDYVKSTIYPVVLPLILPLTLSLLFHFFMDEGVLRLIVVCSVFMLFYFASFVKYSLSKQERETLIGSITRLFKH
jgi:O-antigen/teichoic acid export membrane protein